MGAATLTILEERTEKARKLASAAQRKAKKLAADAEQNRSTRARAALKIKADALDEVAKTLAGKA
jgi:hypothetical protein